MRKPNIVINGRFLVQRVTGVQRFAIETVRAMDQLLDGPSYAHLRGQISILAPAGAHTGVDLRNIAIRSGGRGGGYLWEQVQLPLLVGDATLVSLCALGPVLFRRQLTVIHDVTFLAVPRSFSLVVRLLYRAIVPALIRNSASIMTVSEFTRREIARTLGVEPTSITVCSEGGEQILNTVADVSILPRLSLAAKRFFLAVGMGGPNKNLSTLLAAFAALQVSDVALVITGRRNPRIHADTNDGGDGVIYAGYVDDAELRALYEQAVALVYPSLYEGFGLPPLEAMNCGCPVIGSDQPALVETAGGSALHVPALDVGALAQAMRAVTQNQALRRDLSARGLVRAKDFNWQRTAAIVLDAAIRL